MIRNELIKRIFNQAGPILKYRIAKEFEYAKDEDLDSLKKAFLNTSKVKGLLKELDQCLINTNKYNWHGSDKSCMENVLGRMLELGIDNSLIPLEEKLSSLREYMKIPSSPDHTPIHLIYFLSCFIRGGIYDDEIKGLILKRIDRIYPAAKEKIYRIYIPENQCKGIPKRFVKECIYEELNPYSGKKPLPLIHDIYALAYLPQDMLMGEVANKVNTIIEYIIEEQFQELREGYGYIKAPGKSYCHSCGWSPNLAGYHGYELESIDKQKFLLRVELMSHFPQAVKSKWFKECMKHLEQFADNEGTYHLPKDYISEKASGYYVLGAYMGLEEKRTKKAMELEADFRMLALKERCER